MNNFSEKESIKELTAEKIVHNIMGDDKHKWVLQGLSEEDISLIEKRTISRFKDVIPSVLKLQDMLKDPRAVQLIKYALDRILKSDDSGS